jgi:ankyrin repeat protein/WD40 repeat protein
VYSSGSDVRLCSIDGKYIRSLKGHTDLIFCVLFSPDGEYIITSSSETMMGKEDNSIRIWTKSGRLVRTLRGHTSSIMGLDISRDGRFIASISFDSIRIWGFNGDLLKEIKINGDDERVSFTSDGKHLVYTEYNNHTKRSTIKIAGLDGRLERSFRGYDFNRPSFLCLNEDGNNYAYNSVKAQTLRGWDFSVSDSQGVEIRSIDGRLIKSFNDDPRERTFGVAFSPDDRYFAIAVCNRFSDFNFTKVYLYTTGGKLIRTYDEIVQDISFSPNCEYIAFTSSRGVRLHSLNGKGVKDYKGHSSVSFSLDGRFFSLSFEGMIRILDNNGTVIKTIEEYFGKNRSVVFCPDGKHVATIAFDSTIRLWSINGKLVREIKAHSAPIDNLFISADGRYIITSSHDKTIKVWSFDGKLIHTLNNYRGENWNTSVSFSARSNRIAYISEDGTIKIFNIDTSGHASYLSSGNDWILFTPDGYFDCSENGGRLIAMRKGLAAFGVDQFALRMNRPDIILKRLRFADIDMIDSCYRQYQSRLRKSGLSDEEQIAEFHIPRAEIISKKQEGKFVEITCSLKDTRHSLKSYNIFVNDVPLFGGRGKGISGFEVTKKERIELTYGENKIELSCINEKGSESYRALAFADYNDKTRANLYYMGFGVSHYLKSNMNLGFAHQDAIDLANMFNGMEGKQFNRVYSKTFIDKDVTVENIKKAKLFLKDARVDDTFVLFISGHGMHDRDNDSTYYYLTHEADERNLSSSAARFELLEDILENIAPRHKLFLIDTCESGELDEDLLANSRSLEKMSRGVRARTIRREGASRGFRIQKKRKHLLERNRFIFSDLFRRSGSIVFSSCRGDEVSYENEELHNGFFTEAIIKSFTDRKADKNGNGIISTDEFRSYVINEVPRLCRQFNFKPADEQHPTVDRDNIYIKFGFPNLNKNYLLIHSLQSGDLKAAEGLIKSGSDLNFRHLKGYTPLHVAVLQGKEESVRFLIGMGAQVDAKDEFGNTPLHLAAKLGHTALIALLIEKGASINAVNNESKGETAKSEKTPLHKAVENGRIEAVRMLIDKGADINAKCRYHNMDGTTPLHIASEMGNMSIALLLLNKGDINGGVTTKNSDAWDTPLYRAIKNERRDISLVLIKRGAEIKGKTPVLLAAVERGYLDIAKLLLEKGADVDSQYGFSAPEYNRTFEGRLRGSPLKIAIKNKNADMVRLLIEKGANVNQNAWNGYPQITPIHIAALYGNAEIARMLIEKGADIKQVNKDRVYQSDWYGYQPIHMAALSGNVDVARLLIEKGIDVNSRDMDGETPLHKASNNQDIVRLLIEKGADVNARDSFGVTPLHYAAERGRDRVVQLLIEKGADINSKANNGRTPLHVARRNFEIMRLLIESGADVRIRDSFGATALHDVISNCDSLKMHNCRELVILLIKKDSDVRAKDNDGKTPLHLAVSQGNMDIAGILITSNADVNSRDEIGKTPLHYASDAEGLDLVRLLISRGADVDVKDSTGNTPLHYAAIKENITIAKFLIEKSADVNAVNNDGCTPLYMSGNPKLSDIHASYGVRFTRFLLKKGSRVNIKTNRGSTFLIKAAGMGLSGLCRFLIENGAEINAKNNNGDTPLHAAMRMKGIAVSDTDDSWWEEMGKKIDRSHLITARILLQRGADIGIRNRQGLTPLQITNQKGDSILHSAIINEYPESIPFFIKKGADVNARDNNGDTPLHIATARGEIEAIKHLLKSGADPDIKDKAGKMPIDYAGTQEVQILLKRR